MNYEFIKGDYKEFRGYVFNKGQPTFVDNPGVASILAKDPAYRKVINEEKVEEATEKVLEPCPFCGRELTIVPGPRARHMKSCSKAPRAL